MENFTFPPQLPEMEPEDGKILPEVLHILNYVCGATTISRQTLAADVMEFAALWLKNLDEQKQKIGSLEKELLDLRQEMRNGEVQASPTEERLEELNLPESLNSEHKVECSSCFSDNEEECIQPLFASIPGCNNNDLADEHCLPEVSNTEPASTQEVSVSEEQRFDDEKHVEVESMNNNEVETETAACDSSSTPMEKQQPNSNTDSRLAKKKQRKREQRKAKRQKLTSSSKDMVAGDNCTSEGIEEHVEPLLASTTKIDSDHLAEEHHASDLSKEEEAPAPEVCLSEEKPSDVETHLEDFDLPEPVSSEHKVGRDDCSSEEYEFIWPILSSFPSWYKRKQLGKKHCSSTVTKKEPASAQDVSVKKEEKSGDAEKLVEVESVHNSKEVKTESQTWDSSSPPKENQQTNSNTNLSRGKKVSTRRDEKKAKKQKKRKGSQW